MVEEGVQCSVCQSVANPLGIHQVGCGGNGGRIHRHNSVRDALFSAAQTTALAPRKEMPSLIPGTSSRPAYVYLAIWTRGKPAALDVHVISTLQQLTLKEAATTQGHEERKRAAHSEAYYSAGVTFIPMVVESLGGWGEEAVHTIKNIGRHLFQRLAIILCRGNATLIPTPHSIARSGRFDVTFILFNLYLLFFVIQNEGGELDGGAMYVRVRT